MRSALRTLCLCLLTLSISCADDGAVAPSGSLVDPASGAAGASGASGSDEGAPGRGEADLDTPPSQTEEEERLHKMQLIRLHVDNSDFSVDISAEELGYTFQSICKLREMTDVVDSTGLSEECAQIYPAVRCLVAAAGDLLEVAGSAHAPIPIEGFGWTITPQPAGPRHRLAMLAGLYMEKATRISLMTLQNEAIDADWIAASSFCTLGSCDCNGELEQNVPVTPSGVAAPTDGTLGVRLVSTAVEGYHVLKEAVALAGDIGLSVADSQRSDTSSIVEGVRRQMTAEELSRSALAHMLVGGAPGLSGALSAENLCTTPELSASVQRALALMREAALSPEDLVDVLGTDTEDLIEDDFRIVQTGSALTRCGSLRERLQQRWNDDSLTDATISVPERFGLAMADFREARDYLVREINVFARSRTSTFDAGVCNDTYNSTTDAVTYPKFVATMSEPTPIDPVYWSTLARYTSSSHYPAQDWLSLPFVSPFWTAFGDDPLELSFADRGGLASVVDDFIVRAARTVRNYAQSGLDTDTEQEVGGLLNLMLADARLEREGRLYVMRWSDVNFKGDTYGHLTVPLLWGISATDGAIVVRGEDGLRCALYGNVEGSACNDARLDALTLGQLNGDYYTTLLEEFDALGLPHATSVIYADLFIESMPDDSAAWGVVDTTGVTEPERLYVVKPRPGASAGAGPGEYLSIAGFRHLSTSYAPAVGTEVTLIEGVRDTDVYSIMPDIDDAAAAYIEPNRRWCTNPELTCAGQKFDARISLENELTEDGNDFEDSWRHYLTLARQAADEADDLGQTYLQAEVDSLNSELDEVKFEDQIRERRERELEELQDICGTSIATEKLFQLLVPGGDIRSAAPVNSCTGPSDPTCLTRHSSCYAGQCITNMSTLMLEGKDDPDIYRLYQCLRSADSTAIATPGDEELCVTLARGNRNRICQTNIATLDASTCPQIRDGRDCNTVFAPVLHLSAGDTTEVVKPLNYFDTKAAPPPPIDAVAVCDAFRKARGNAEAAFDNGGISFSQDVANEQVQRLLDDTFFFENVQRVAEKIGWASPAPSGAMQFRGASIYPAAGGGWPCAGEWPNQAVQSSCADPLNADSFFCQQLDCSDPAQMGAWSRRALWGTVALRAMAYRGAASKFALSTGEFVPVDPLAGVSILAYGPSNPQGATIFPSRTTDPWTPGHKLFATWIAGSPYSYDQLQVLQTNSAPPTTAGDFFFHGPNGETIPTAGPGGSKLAVGWLGSLGLSAKVTTRRVDDGLFCGNNTRVTVHPLKPAPLWWKGLSVSDAVLNRAPRVDGLNCPDLLINSNSDCARASRGDYNNDSWIRRYLLRELPDGAVAPVDSLWRTRTLTIRRGGQDITEAVLATALTGGLFSGCSDSDSYSFGPNVDSLIAIENQAITNGTSTSPTAVLTMQSPRPSAGWEINRSVLDAVEMFCHYELEYDQPPLIALDHPPVFNSIDDLDDVGEYFRLVANELNGAAGRLVFANLPNQAIDALELNPVNSAYPGLGGELAKSILSLRGALIQLASAAPGLATEIELLGNDMRELQGRLRIVNLQRDQVDIRLLAESVQRVSDCVASASPTVTAGPIPSASFNTGAVAICANAFAQIEFSGQLSNLEDDVLEEQAALAINDFSEIITKRREVMRDFADHIREANEIINQDLADIDLVKNKARRAVQRALFMQTEQAEKQAEVSGAMRARTNVGRERYERALDNARRLSYLAKRAIEQRIGMHLSEMREDLPLVEAPSSWEARVCSTTGVDFETFQMLADVNPDSPRLDAFADQYIGDYVTHLENLVESYPLSFNFHEGEDTAVVSLRDDIFNSKVMCDVPSGNLLYYAGDLGELVDNVDDASTLDPGAAGWVLQGCARDTDGRPLRDCISVDEVVGDSPLPGSEAASGQRIAFGEDGSVCDYGNTSDPDRCGYAEESVLRQDVYLESGSYLLSWYAKSSSAAANLLSVRDANGATINAATVAETPASTDPWQRYFVAFNMPAQGIVSMVLAQPATAPAEVIVAATMLEDVTELARTTALVPRPYAPTGSSLDRTVAACADRFGTGFADKWRYRCAHLCPNGFGASCGSDSTSTQCFYELSFGLSQREIEQGALLSYASFAKGNFNYRLNTLAVNFVGTGTRDCGTDTTSSCYTAGFVPYSIAHDGPFTVRNHIGGDFEAKIFSGAIEHARGLAAERVITNPISSADRDLLQDYQRTELRGRPMDGVFTLRVWDEPGVDFSAIEDVQLVMGYRYWTRFE